MARLDGWLLLRLVLGSLAGLPFGLIACDYADPFLVRTLVGATTLARAVIVGVPFRTWISAGMPIPFAVLGGLAAQPLGDRLSSDSLTTLAILLLGPGGIYILAAAVGVAVR